MEFRILIVWKLMEFSPKGEKEALFRVVFSRSPRQASRKLLIFFWLSERVGYVCAFESLVRIIRSEFVWHV